MAKLKKIKMEQVTCSIHPDLIQEIKAHREQYPEFTTGSIVSQALRAFFKENQNA